MQPDVRRLPVADGVFLHARMWPAVPEGPAARPFLLVHGLSSNCRTWEFVAHRLQAEGHHVVAVDLRGHGESDKPENGYDFSTLTADLLAVIDAAGLDRPVIAGQSTGGNLAVDLAYRAPDRIAAAIGVDGGALELQFRWPEWDECQAALAPPRFDGTPARELTGAIREAHPDWPDAAVAATLANCELLADGTVRPWLTYERHVRILKALWEHRPSTQFPRLRVPLLLVMAEADDVLAPARAEEAARASAVGPDVQVEWLAGAHDLHVDRPDTLAALFLDFLRRAR